MARSRVRSGAPSPNGLSEQSEQGTDRSRLRGCSPAHISFSAADRAARVAFRYAPGPVGLERSNRLLKGAPY